MFSIIFLWLFIIFLIVVLLRLLNIKKNYIICFCITLFIVLFILNLEGCMSAALEGSSLVVKAILPTIFPFSVICNLLISYDGITLYSKLLGPLICKPLRLSKNCSFPIAASFICGYPLGAKYSSDIYSLNYIEKEEYERLLNIASNAGPIFILGSVGASMLSDSKMGYILLIANYLSIIIVGFLTKKSSNSIVEKNYTSSNIDTRNFGTKLKDAIDGGISTTLNVAAFVIIFSVFISIIKNNAYISIVFNDLENFIKIPKGTLYNLFLGSIEFTNGCKLISLSSLSINLKLSMISFICSFSSLSVIAQVSSVVSNCNPSMGKYIFWKLIQGIISFIITFIASNIFIISTPTSTPIQNVNIYENYYKFIIPIIIFLLLSLILSIIYKNLNKLHSS
ncbi:sporulation integral membrane protein YlbJ [Clostridium carnis]